MFVGKYVDKFSVENNILNNNKKSCKLISNYFMFTDTSD